LKITAVDITGNEDTKIISFNVDHAFVPEPAIIHKERESSSENSLLIVVSTIIVAAIMIPIIIKRIRKTSAENKILKEDL